MRRPSVFTIYSLAWLVIAVLLVVMRFGGSSAEAGTAAGYQVRGPVVETHFSGDQLVLYVGAEEAFYIVTVVDSDQNRYTSPLMMSTWVRPGTMISFDNIDGRYCREGSPVLCRIISDDLVVEPSGKG